MVETIFEVTSNLFKKKRRALYIDIGKETFNFNPKMYVSLCCMAESIIRKILRQIDHIYTK